jgi:hypothetical protein
VTVADLDEITIVNIVAHGDRIDGPNERIRPTADDRLGKNLKVQKTDVLN